MLLDLIVELLVSAVVVYVLYLHWEIVPFLVAFGVLLGIHAGFSDRLKKLTQHDTFIWIGLGLFVAFVSSFSHTKNHVGFYGILGCLVLIATVTLFCRSYGMVLLTMFLFLYLAFSLLLHHAKHVADLQAQTGNVDSSAS